VLNSAAGAGLVIGALEDDDGDDATSGNCGWVLSFKKVFCQPFSHTSKLTQIGFRIFFRQTLALISTFVSRTTRIIRSSVCFASSSYFF